jgi:hypothetical protein
MDPKLTISGTPIPVISEDEGFKFLGVWFHPSGSIDAVKTRLVRKLETMLDKIDASGIDDTQKVHAVRENLRSWLGWERAVYPFALSFVQDSLDSLVVRFYARWLHLPPCASRAVLLLPASMHGLRLPCPSTMFKVRQIATAHTLRHSRDPATRKLADLLLQRQRGDRQRSLLPMVELANFEAEHADKAAQRKAAAAHFRALDDQARLEHVKGLIVQGKAFKVLGELTSHDADWSQQLAQLPPSLFKWGVRALLDVLPTGSNLFRWNKRGNKSCPHCHERTDTLLHQLNNCEPMLRAGKYTWRHNSVLQYLAALVSPLLCNGFELFVDLPRHSRSYADFPADIVVTLMKPDILVMNRATRTIHLVELTVPFEENLLSAAQRKHRKYLPLVGEIESAGWQCQLFTVEVGSRGALARPVSALLNGLAGVKACRGVTPGEIKQASRIVSQIALRCSYVIYLTRSSTSFDVDRPLLML